VSSFATLRTDWQPAVWVFAILTLVLGASVALVQRDVKRMMAYSSINHAGFILLGLQAASAQGVQGSLYYLFVYTFMVIGSFAVIMVVGRAGDGSHDLSQYRGLAQRQPWLAGSLTVLLIAQAGIPFTTGFLAKLEVVEAAVKANSTALAVIAMVTAVIAAFFYLRVILYMYSSSAGLAGAAAPDGRQSASGDEIPVTIGPASSGPSALATATAPTVLAVDTPAVDGAGVEAPPVQPVSPAVAAAIALCVAVTVLFGLWPAPIVNFAHHAVLYATHVG
jgi:NADH-quinone oxidoreductase subunit N